MPIASSVSSIHAAYPLKKESSDGDRYSSDFFFQIKEDDVKIEDDDYSVLSNDERKRPASSIVLNSEVDQSRLSN